MSDQTVRSDPVRNYAGPGTVGQELAIDWLENVALPRLVVGAQMQVVWANAAARSALAPGGCVSIVDDHLQFADLRGHDYWRGVLSDTGEDLRRKLVFDREGNAHAVIGTLAREIAGGKVVCMSYVTVAGPLDIDESGLSDEFGLTKSETRVAQMLANLMTPRDVADTQAVSINTVRTHIRSSYGKFGVRSQGELLRLISSYCIA